MKDILKTEPVAIAATLTAILNSLVLAGVFSLTDEQLGGINAALAAVLGLLVRSQVTPTASQAAQD